MPDEQEQQQKKNRRRRILLAILIAFVIWQSFFQTADKTHNEVANVGCVSAEDVPSGDRAPFLFYTEERHQLNATSDPGGSGMCIFPGNNCSTSSLCCEVAHWASAQYETALNIAGYGPPFVIALIALVKVFNVYFAHQRELASVPPEDRAEREQELRQQMLHQYRGEQLQGAAATIDREMREFTKWVNDGSYCRKLLLSGVSIIFVLAMLGEAYIQQFKHSFTQRLLPLPDRNAMALSDHFLTPVHEVFQFLEDAVNVKLTFAIAVGDLSAGRAILKLGTVGGLVLGALGACVVTALCFWPTALHILVNPDAHLNPSGCDISGKSTVSAAQMYLILSVWRWPFMFANMAMAGYVQGTGSLQSLMIYFGVFAFENLLQLVAYIVIFPLDPSLRLVAVFHCIPSLFSFVVYGLLIRRLHAQEKYTEAERKELEEPTVSLSSSVSRDLGEADSLWGDAAREGLCAMVVDLSVHANVTIGMYMTGFQLGAGALYQLSFLQSVIMQFGSQFISQLKYTVKLQVAPLIAHKKYKEFRAELMYLVIATVLIIILSCAATLPFRQGVVFTLASSACSYAGDSACLPIYDAIFGGARELAEGPRSNIQQTFLMATPILGARIFFAVFRAGLYCCCDFPFMARIAGASSLLICLPAFLAVTQGLLPFTPISVQMVMYLPYFTLSIVFAFRLLYIMRKMMCGEGGPWLQVKMLREQ